MIGYTTRGRRSGPCGHVHGTEEEAGTCLQAHQQAQGALGERSDRKVYPYSRRGRKAEEDVTRTEQVAVRLTPEEAGVLDSIKGDLSRAGWFRACLQGARRTPDQSTT